VRVLGIDPGLTRCGYGIIETNRGKAVLVDVGVIRSATTDALEQRLLTISQHLEELMDEFSPHSVAVERVFAQANVRTVMGTAQVSGLALVHAAARGLEVATYTPSEVKAAVTGHGRADKAQVMTMVAKILGLSAAPKPADAADALAIAVCHTWRGAGKDRIAQAVRRQSA
jgi:crossover junction endodeoxyribonuclease RuvC